MVEHKGMKPGEAWQQQVDQIPLECSRTPEDVANLVFYLAINIDGVIEVH